MMKLGLGKMWMAAALAAGMCASHSARAQDKGTFTNPLLPGGADPWVYTYGGFYYYMNTTGKNLVLRKTKDITDLKDAQKKVIWEPPASGPYSQAIWAPEIHRWGEKWYVYFAASGGTPESRRNYVLENANADPMEGTWTFKGEITDPSNHWAIDPDIFEVKGVHYIVWSGWEGDHNGTQNIYIARMSNPWTIDSARTLISTPTYDWEKHYGNGKAILVNEGPEGLVHGDDVFVVFSASGCWTPFYELGAVRASAGADLLKAKSWKKIDHPLFQQDPKAGVYGTGHNGFFKSLDGKQDWIIYHANDEASQGCGGSRSPRIQPFTWNADGTPNFGAPIAPGVKIAKPE